jgi:hypothetical protein
MGKPIHIFHIAPNYTSATVYWGSRMVGNLLGTSKLVLDRGKGITRKERYDIIAKWLYEQTGHPSPSYRPTPLEIRQRNNETNDHLIGQRIRISAKASVE